MTSAGVPGETFEPRRITHGFQYVRIEGHPDDLAPQDVTGVVVHTDLRRTGWFSCSDERINRLHEAVVWSLRDNAYELLRQDTAPSWLAMIDRGATTVWEDWNGVSVDGKAAFSLNHYSKGAVVSFLHRHVAGIELLDDAPAYRQFRVRPRPGGGVTWAEAAHESPYGRIESAWRLDGDRFRLRVVVPAGTQATVVLPGGRADTAAPGVHTYVDELNSNVPAPTRYTS